MVSFTRSPDRKRIFRVHVGAISFSTYAFFYRMSYINYVVVLKVGKRNFTKKKKRKKFILQFRKREIVKNNRLKFFDMEGDKLIVYRSMCWKLKFSKVSNSRYDKTNIKRIQQHSLN